MITDLDGMHIHSCACCVAVCCGELQCVPVCCSVLQCVAGYDCMYETSKTSCHTCE